MFKLLAVALLLVHCVVYSSQRQVGRIIGGEVASIKDYPYQASFHYIGTFVCGCSIISENYVLTAAHCIFGGFLPAMSVRVGSSSRNSGGVVYKISQAVKHESYYFSDYDIGLLKLRTPITFSSTIQPVALPLGNEVLETGKIALVSGWGASKEGGVIPSYLMAVGVEVVNQDACEVFYSDYSISTRMMCAGLAEGGKDACQGDSGGPLVLDGVQIGIVSWGVGCARPGRPGVYTRVAQLRSWIKDKSGV